MVDDDRVRDREDNDDANGEDDGEDYEIEEGDDAGEEDEDDEGEDLGDDSKDDADADKAMHAKKGLPCVPVGQNFTIRGTEFQRTGTKQAACMRCKHAFVPKAYGKQIMQHAVKCARVAVEKESREAARAQAKVDDKDPEVKNADWIGKHNTVTETVDGVAVTVQFENLVIGEHAAMVFVLCILVSIRRGKIVVCPELLFADKIKSSRCLTPETCTKPDPTFRQTGNGPWSAHITKWHKPTPPPVAEKKREETRAAVLGTKGLGLKSFFKKASPAPSKASAPPSQAKDGGAPILPPPPPLLARRTSVALPPPLAPFIQPTSVDPFHVRLQRLILSHFASEAPGPLYICPGNLLELPNPAVLNYPYELSNALDRVKQPGVACDISWSVPDDDGRVRSKSCLVKTPADDEPCENCDLLKGSTLLAAVLRRAWDTTLHLGTTNDGFLSISQQSLRLKHRRGLYENLRLRSMNQNSKLTRLLKRPSAVDRITTALATGNCKKVHVIMRRLRAKNATPAAYAKILERAADGYVPKGGVDRKGFAKAFLHLALGGRRALRLEMVEDGAPSRREIFRSKLFKVPRHYATVGPLLVDEDYATRALIHHVNQYLSATVAEEDHKYAWHELFDNVNMDERLRYSVNATFGGCHGIGRESTFSGSAVIRSWNDVKVIEQALESGEILLTKETTVLIAIRNSDPPVIVPLFSSGTAKVKGYGKAHQDQAFMLEQVSVRARRHPPSEATLGFIV
jgi:hypothetical protein